MLSKTDHHAPHRSRLPGGSPLVTATAWLALVSIGICGRLWQPADNVTPMAGVAIAAGALFANPLVAASVPVAALAGSNLLLPGYGSAVLAAVVFAATAWPVLLPRFVPRIREGSLGSWIGGALACSLVFFVATNLAYWWLFDDYPHTATGLVECFWMALPFYRWMPVGDVAWTTAILCGLRAAAASTATVSRTA